MAGVIFSATPPTKKFSIGTDSLSSGEASLANLALFLAINQVKETPIIFFDEIDAHLDSENVIKFLSSVGKFSEIRQIVFISHKPFVFKKADVLLGLTRDHQRSTSTCFSFNPKTHVKAV